MLQLLADRFICDRGRWFDLATARPVNVRLNRASTRQDHFEWSDRCAALSRLRHPLLNPLLDYGHAASQATFEAYAVRPPLRAGTVAGSHAATHAVRFLRAHAIAVTRELATVLVRPLLPGGRSGRPIGIVLQHRKVLDVLTDVLNGSGQGPITIAVTGPPHSGIRTLRLAFARAARLAGYVPVGVESVHRWRELPELTAGRHVCVISDDESKVDAAARACWLARLGLESTRRHLHLSFVRCANGAAEALRLDPLGVSAMRSMIYTDPDFGPSGHEIVAAVRVADGWPGRLLSALRAEPHDGPTEQAVCTVHESPAPYVVTPSTGAAATLRAKPMRLASALARAERRAVSLAAVGRHAAAIRLLERAVRLFEARGVRDGAGRCAMDLAWIHRSRGHNDDARAQVHRARLVTANPSIHVAAATAAGVLWTDEGQFVEGEAALRSAAAAAATLQEPDLVGHAAIGLARALFWQDRHGEALAVLEGLNTEQAPEISCAALAFAARIHAAAGDVAAALGAASQALQRSAVLRDPRLDACARRAMAVGLMLASDSAGAIVHIRAGLRAAALAHRPLTALRLRALLLSALRRMDSNQDEVRRLHDALQTAVARRSLPEVVRLQIASACEVRRQTPNVYWPSRRQDAAEIVTELVDVSQRAPDDGAALVAVLDLLVSRLQAASAIVVAGPDSSRVLATSGRPWRERSASARTALESGLSSPVNRAVPPPEAGEPVKYAGSTIAAIACRWLPGTSIDPGAAATYLNAAALAVSTYAHALLDVPGTPCPTVWGDLLGGSPAAAALREAVQRAARTPFPVLIEGESGSGKELAARAIHRLSARSHRRFCAINCAAISDELVEAELFGHTRGAFTGASAERAGLFEEADGGSLFLDEIGELSTRAQAKLLRVLQDGEVRRVGENFPRRVDVRLIAATNRRLEQEVAAGRFRADLRFRLDVIRISVPPLRDRVADIPLLAAHFWHDAAARVGSRATLGPETLAALSRYDWPGNVRELQNAIAWIAVHAPRRGRIGTSLLPSQLAAAAPLSTGSFEAAREDFERRFVRAALAQAGGHRTRTAEALGVSRQGLAKILRRLGLET
jgi:transcriptional regulator with AAA-type ATPase domain/tetratricopeptide (TPR) repeat protein